MKKLLTYVLAFSLMFTLIPSSVSANGRKSFKDIKHDHWAKTAIEKLVSKDVIAGYPDGTFKPENKINRAELAKILVTALSLECNENAKSTFSDVPDDYWATKYIEAAKWYMIEAKIPEETAFEPEKEVFREDIIKALIKASKLNTENIGREKLNEFSDKDKIDEVTGKYFECALEHQIINGYDDGYHKVLKPKKPLSRAELAKMLINMDEKTEVHIGRHSQEHKKDPRKNNKHKEDYNEHKEGHSIPATIDLSIDKVSSGLDLSWDKQADKIEHYGFRFYKVVASLENPNPKYPEDGYSEYITDINKTDAHIAVSDSYTRGDFSKFESGKEYYISITAVYEDKHYKVSNVIKTKID